MAWFSCAVSRPIGVNQGGAIADPSRGLLLHHQAGNGSLFGWFSNPAAGVSAHWWVGKSGVIEQYVDSSRTAWHAISGNVTHGVETEGCPAGRDEPLTDLQIEAMGRLYAEGMRVHGWPPQLANAAGARGLGYHRLYVNTACPCQMRVDARAEILRRATGGGGEEEDVNQVQDDKLSSIFNVLAYGTLGPSMEGQRSWLYERLVDGTETPQPAKYGALGTVDDVLRFTLQNVQLLHERLDRIEQQLARQP